MYLFCLIDDPIFVFFSSKILFNMNKPTASNLGKGTNYEFLVFNFYQKRLDFVCVFAREPWECLLRCDSSHLTI